MADTRGQEEPPEKNMAGLAVAWVTEDAQWRTRG